MTNKRKRIIITIIISLIIVSIGTIFINKLKYNRSHPVDGVEVITAMELPTDISSRIDDSEVGNYTIVEMEKVKYVIIKPYYGTILLLKSVSKETDTMIIKYSSMFIDESSEQTPLILRIDNYIGEISVSEIH